MEMDEIPNCGSASPIGLLIWWTAIQEKAGNSR